MPKPKCPTCNQPVHVPSVSELLEEKLIAEGLDPYDCDPGFPFARGYDYVEELSAMLHRHLSPQNRTGYRLG